MPRSGRRPLSDADVKRKAFLVSCALAAAAALSGCRTSRPAVVQAPLQPIAGASRDSVVSDLQRQMSRIHAIRSLMRIRVARGQHTLSFRAQMLVEPKTRRMQLIAYTPFGTEAMTISADGDRAVFLDHIRHTAWEGSASELASSVSVLDPELGLAEWALDIAGFPARGDFVAADAGLASVSIADLTMTFEPPSFPPLNVIVTRAGQKVEITHLDLVSTDADVPEPAIPKGYRCCVAPQM